ncbi:MAG: nucleotidyltransferase family protein [Gammaproteobacteria bacterium]|nr:nucleotidyltransferase family protein [Gammaproteobacteria bacterium]
MIQGLILAAGKSTRFGNDKLVYKLDNGRPMVLQSALNMRESITETLVLLSRDRETICGECRAHNIATVISENSHLGMGHTIADGIKATSNASGWVIALGDMPFLNPETLLRVKQTIENGATLVVPIYKGKRGHPVGFSSAFKSELLSLQGDTGARELLRKHKNKITYLACDDSGVHRDIDVPEDLLT